MKRRLAALFLLTVAPLAAAQGFPFRPVTLLVSPPAGGPTDIAARALAGDTRSRIPVTVFRLPHRENLAFDPRKDIRYAIGE
jgi:tripartite-type tricarboxylate transporter receptor subunit TctC